MTMQRIEARGLADAPLDAAADFTGRFLPHIRAGFPQDAVILFDAADHTHETWRRAMIEELAREAVPGRVNAIVGQGEAAIAQTIAFLENAPGVTGQIFTLA